MYICFTQPVADWITTPKIFLMHVKKQLPGPLEKTFDERIKNLSLVSYKATAVLPCQITDRIAEPVHYDAPEKKTDVTRSGVFLPSDEHDITLKSLTHGAHELGRLSFFVISVKIFFFHDGLRQDGYAVPSEDGGGRDKRATRGQCVARSGKKCSCRASCNVASQMLHRNLAK